MKRFIAIFAVFAVMAFAFVPCFGETVADGSEVIADGAETQTPVDITDGEADTAQKEAEFEQLMTELYEYWQSYTSAEGDNAFEKAVNFAWRYRGDVGGVSAAVAVVILLIFMLFRFMPTLKKYFDYIYKGNAKTKAEITEEVRGEISKYAPALSTVEQVAELYGSLKQITDKMTEENKELMKLVSDIGARVEATERRHAAEMKLQGETFRDIISLSALPAGKKAEILDNYRAILEENVTERGDGEAV